LLIPAGKETTFFGVGTLAALTNFQKIHAKDILAITGPVKTPGVLDLSTRSYIDSLTSTTTVSCAAQVKTVAKPTPVVVQVVTPKISTTVDRTCSSITAANFVFSRDLTVGSSGADVKNLQIFLRARGFLNVPAGSETSYFGSGTLAALTHFQEIHGNNIALFAGAVENPGVLGLNTRNYIVYLLPSTNLACPN
jgi:peptidoglycan hydrolase-like protein with peptidoglycan-binding domain